MVESSKILTVSYGTFSCTLEGFDDSFSTMKAIAEYFRDLAADDRYFGAEPPTPDAEMLGRIAEREIERRVEARTSKEGIHLKAAAPALTVVEPAMPPEPQRPAAAPDMSDLADMGQDEMPVADEDTEEVAAENTAEHAAFVIEDDSAVSEDTAEAVVETAAEDDAAEAFFAQDTAPEEEVAIPVTEAPAHPDPSSVAAKLQRIRAVVGAADDTVDDAFAEDIPSAPVNSDDLSEIAQNESGDAEMDADITVAAEMQIAEVEADATETADLEDEDLADFASALEDDDHFDGDDDAAEDAQDVTLDDMSFEEETEGEAVDARSTIADILGDAGLQSDDEVSAEDAYHAEDGSAEKASIAVPDNTDDQISAVLRNLERAGATIPDDVAITPITSAPSDETDAMAQDDASQDAAEEAAEAKPTLRARILRVAKRVAPPTTEAPADAEDEADDDAMLSNLADDNADLMADVETDIAMAEAEEAEANAAEVSIAALDGADDLTDFDDIVATDLPDAEEEDLQRALEEASFAEDADDEVVAAAEDIADTDDHAAEITDDLAAKEDETAARQGRSALPKNDDAAMSRIMEQADEELSNPESSRRRAAIAQLKAAVAATEAARQLGEDGAASKPKEDPFREDLNQVVRPRRAARPTTQETRSERPRPAPLKLVASQRVDTADAPDTDAGPVQPRRIALSTPVNETDADNFAEFAEEMGATDLPDLLEAAAAYTAYVEGSADFSRPQIMKKVQATADQAFTREDGLRSFGTLLRQGRINKAGNGRFQISDETRFKPEQKVG